MKPTVNPTTLERWRAHRAKGLPPSRFETHPAPPKTLDWDDSVAVEWFGQRLNVREATWVEGDFRYRARFGPDDGDTEILHGEFVDEGTFPEELYRRHTRRDEYKYFCPSPSVKERTRDNSRRGMARSTAYEEALREAYEDMARAESFGDRWSWYGLRVEVFRKRDRAYAHPLGEDTVWRYESDIDEEGLTMFAFDHAQQALADAKVRKTLPKKPAPFSLTTVKAVLKKEERRLNKVYVKLGEEIRTKVLIPLCKKHQLTFSSGNGTYAFFHNKPNERETLVGDRETCVRRAEAFLNLLEINGECIGNNVRNVYEKDYK